MNVRQFEPKNGLNLDNIPHMLRWWADAMERGEEPMPKTALMAMSFSEDEPATLCVFGQNMSPVALAGTLMACAMQPIATVEA